MRKRRGETGVSLGTMVTFVLLALVIGGCGYLFPKLLGQVDQRIDPQLVSVALENSFQAFSDSVLGQTTEEPLDYSVTVPPVTDSSDAAETTDTDSDTDLGNITQIETATPTPAPSQTLTITIAGEMSFDRTIQTSCTNDSGYDFDFLFEEIESSFTSDINLATLQNTVVTDEELTNINMPSAALTAIANSGINVLCTGFYDALNSGITGLSQTLSLMEENGILPYGTYTSEEHRNQVVTMDVNGVTVAFLSFQGELSSEGMQATTNEEQEYVFAALTLPEITAEISAARAAGAKIVIVSLCWGREGATEPTTLQQEMAQGIAEAGADIIIGTNPGVLQTVEILTSTEDDGTQRQTLCAYSLGSILNSDRTDRSVITSVLLHLSLEYDQETDELVFETIEYSPVYIRRGSSDGKTFYQPVIANADPPEDMNDDQQAVMGRSLNDVREIFENSVIVER